jgi:hypothetical protein
MFTLLERGEASSFFFSLYLFFRSFFFFDYTFSQATSKIAFWVAIDGVKNTSLQFLGLGLH